MSKSDSATVASLNGFDKLLEHRVRLAICVLLSRHDSISFRSFKELLDETDGNLGANLRKLEDEGYIEVDKQFADRKPVSWYRITDQGRKSLVRHVESLTGLLKQVE